MTRKEIITEFHKLYYDEGNRSPILNNTRWMGVPLLKCPLDLWIYQEIMFEVKPRLIIETGTLHGGSALWFAQMMNLIHAQANYQWYVATVDIKPMFLSLSNVGNLGFYAGSSTSKEIIKAMEALKESYGRPIMVVLDSDHRASHVYQELEIYSKFVTPGSYLIVEDTNINNHPVLPGWGAGPMEAIESWLPKHPEFEIDDSREKFMLTMNPKGYLKRVK